MEKKKSRNTKLDQLTSKKMENFISFIIADAFQIWYYCGENKAGIEFILGKKHSLEFHQYF